MHLAFVIAMVTLLNAVSLSDGGLGAQRKFNELPIRDAFD